MNDRPRRQYHDYWVDSGHRDNNPDIGGNYRRDSGNCCKSLFTCCFNFTYDDYDDSVLQYDTDEYEYIVEKLLIKRVPLALVAIPQDYPGHEVNVQQSGPSNAANFSGNAKRFYDPLPNIQTINYQTETTVDRLAQVSSSKNAHLTSSNDVLDEGNVNTSDSRPERKKREAAIMDRFSAFHPDLKESERPPKDPEQLNGTNVPLIKSSTEIPRKKSMRESADSVESKHSMNIDKFSETDPYSSNSSSNPTQSNPRIMKELSVPRRSSNPSQWFRRKRSRSVNRGSGESGEALENVRITTSDSNKHSAQSSSRQRTDKQKFIVSPVQLNWNSVEADNTKAQTVKLERFSRVSEQKHLSLLNVQNTLQSAEDSLVDKLSDSADEVNGNDIGSTTLKWRITIKHRQADALDDESRKKFPLVDMLRFKNRGDNDDH